MANAVRGNKISIDSTGSITTDAVKIAHIVFTPANNNDSVTLRETSSGPDIIKVQSADKSTKHLRFEDVPINFQNGLYVQAISSGAILTLISTSRGAG